MAKNNKPKEDQEEKVEDLISEAEEAKTEETESLPESDKSELDKLKEDYAAIYDKYIRLVAEFDNFKKRTVKEKGELYAAAKSDVVEKLLPVIDNLERAEIFTDPEKVSEGIQLILKQFAEYLEKLDIHEIPAQDAEFNPELHNAVMHDQNEELPQNTVVEVFQKGYMVGDKVLRHAMVKVSN